MILSSPEWWTKYKRPVNVYRPLITVCIYLFSSRLSYRLCLCECILQYWRSGNQTAFIISLQLRVFFIQMFLYLLSTVFESNKRPVNVFYVYRPLVLILWYELALNWLHSAMFLYQALRIHVLVSCSATACLSDSLVWRTSPPTATRRGLRYSPKARPMRRAMSSFNSVPSLPRMS